MFDASKIAKHVVRHGDSAYLLHLEVESTRESVCVKHIELVVDELGAMDFSLQVYWSTRKNVRLPLLTRAAKPGVGVNDAHIRDVQETLRSAGFSEEATSSVSGVWVPTLAPSFHAQAVASEVRRAMSSSPAQS